MTIARVLLLSYLLAFSVRAEQYWVAYEGNDFPENEGWTRVSSDANGQMGQGGAVRSLEGGELVLDSTESLRIVDFYRMSRSIDPAEGELFVMQWRAEFELVEPFEDPGVSVFSDDFSAVAFEFTETGLRSVLEPGVAISFASGAAHEFELRSSNLLDYQLLIDGSTALSGTFQPVFSNSRVGWGDVIQGGRSISRWDYFRFGVVPEPSTSLALSFGVFFLCRRQYGDTR